MSDVYEDKNLYKWDLKIEGKVLYRSVLQCILLTQSCCSQNCLHIFGVTVTSTSSWTFKISQIEEPVTPSVFHPHSSSWVAPPIPRAHHQQRQLLRQCLLLGLLEIKIKAIPPSNKKKQHSSGAVSAEVRLDLGFKQCFIIPLRANTGQWCLSLACLEMICLFVCFSAPQKSSNGVATNQ